MSFNLSSIIAHHADRNPDGEAVSMDAEQRSWGALNARTATLAGALRDAGVKPGDVVALLLHNSIEFVELLCATGHLGAIVMPLNWRLAPAELAYICNNAGASLLVSEPELRDALAPVATGADAPTCLTLGEPDALWQPLEEAASACAPVLEPVPVASDDVHRLMYTSGTSARPKGVIISYSNLYAKCAAQVVELGLTQADRGLACGPLYHVGALDVTTTSMLYLGASTHILRRFDAVAVADAIERRGITNVWMAPAMINAMLESGAAVGRDMSSLRVVVDGGEKMPLSLIDRVLETFPNAWFADAYGLTETVGGDTFLNKGKLKEKLGSVGKPVLHTEVRIVDETDRTCAAGEVGEIVLRGPKVCKGYWADPEATAHTLRGGWLHTGDLGYIDDDGYLFIVDRLKDIIVSGGENISSLEVERAIYEHDDVVEAAVVARPDPRWNEVPVAYVVVREGSSENPAALERFCSERLARFKTPKTFRFVEALPRNPSGKVLKRELREREAVQAATDKA
jgi:fatty-acyl-CoA synthase